MILTLFKFGLFSINKDKVWLEMAFVEMLCFNRWIFETTPVRDISQFQSTDTILCVSSLGGVGLEVYFCSHLLVCMFYCGKAL